MYTLYYHPGSASMVVHLALLEIGAPYKLEKVERLITGGNVITGTLGAKYERPCDTGPCGTPACGGGMCSFE